MEDDQSIEDPASAEEPADYSHDEPAAASHQDDELDAAKIRRVAIAGRALIRARSYYVIAAGGCLFLAALLIYTAIGKLVAHYQNGALVPGARGRQLVQPIVLLIVAGASLIALPPLIKRIRLLGREYDQMKMPEPTSPPDFSTLSDGSQRYSNLENIHFDEPDES